MDILVVTLIIGCIAAQRAWSRGYELTSLLLALTTCVIVTPTAWPHYFTYAPLLLLVPIEMGMKARLARAAVATSVLMFFPLYSFVYPVHPTTVWSIIYTTISRDIFLAAALLFLITSLLKSRYAASPGDPSPGSKHSDAAFTPSQTEQHATTAPRSQRSPVMAKQTPPYFPPPHNKHHGPTHLP